MKIKMNTQHSVINNIKRKIAIPMAAMALTVSAAPSKCGQNCEKDTFVANNKNLIENQAAKKSNTGMLPAYILFSLGTGFIFGYLFAGLCDPDRDK